MDDADRAQRHTDQALQIALSNLPQIPRLPYTGNCHWCDAPVPERRRFCDRYCADDWEADWTRKQGAANA